MDKSVIVSGIQPTGPLHIGNYLGALKNFVALQESGKYSPFFFVADLHSLNEEFTPEQKTAHIIDAAASFLAAGLDPKRSTLFIQSQVAAHSELAWILDCLTPLGELERMTQFKDKGEARGSVNAGLFTYPVLMAADVLLYDAVLVPTGDDQDQHIELARTLARKFNSRFGKIFFEPKGAHTAVTRLMSLDEPTKKMSKSRPAGCLFMDDAPEVIEKKIMTAVTDSGRDITYNPEKKPGVSNLLLIESELTGKPVEAVAAKYSGRNYGEFKKEVAKIVAESLAPFRQAKAKLLQNPKSVLKVFAKGADKARKIADAKMDEVRKKIGLI